MGDLAAADRIRMLLHLDGSHLSSVSSEMAKESFPLTKQGSRLVSLRDGWGQQVVHAAFASISWLSQPPNVSSAHPRFVDAPPRLGCAYRVMPPLAGWIFG